MARDSWSPKTWMALHPRSDQFCGCIGASFLRGWLFQLQAGLSTYRPWNNPQRWRQSLVDDDDDDDDHVKILGLQFGKFCKATHWHRIFMHVSWLRIKIVSPPGKLQIETMGFAWFCNGSSSIHFGGPGVLVAHLPKPREALGPHASEATN